MHCGLTSTVLYCIALCCRHNTWLNWQSLWTHPAVARSEQFQRWECRLLACLHVCLHSLFVVLFACFIYLLRCYSYCCRAVNQTAQSAPQRKLVRGNNSVDFWLIFGNYSAESIRQLLNWLHPPRTCCTVIICYIKGGGKRADGPGSHRNVLDSWYHQFIFLWQSWSDLLPTLPRHGRRPQGRHNSRWIHVRYFVRCGVC